MENYRVTATFSNGTAQTKVVQAEDEEEALYRAENEFSYPDIEVESFTARYHTLGDVGLSEPKFTPSTLVTHALGEGGY